MHQNTVKNKWSKYQTSVENYVEKSWIPKLSSLLMMKSISPFQVLICPGNAGFYSSDKDSTPSDVKYKSKQKFEPKILVWLALSSKGISAPYIGTTKGLAVDANDYIEKCLPKLIKFTNEHHSNDKYIFWPDLASSHYAKKSTDWLNERKVSFVPKPVNPPNVPKARPF